MNPPITQTDFLFAGAAEMLVLLGFGAAVIVPVKDQWSKRFFIIFFLILVLYSSFGIADMIITYNHPDMISALKIIYYIETLLGMFLMPMMTAYLLHCCGINHQNSRLFRAVTVIWVICFIILNISQFTTLIYYITPGNQFQRGPLYPLMIILMGSIMILNLAGALHMRNRLSKRYFYAFLISFLPLTIALFVHLFVSVFSFLSFGIAICAFAMFTLILSDQIEQNLRQQREIANQRASIMVLQMRPHFIHNTMTSIYYLCGQDPQKAQQVTLDFNTYLRKNFNAIVSEHPVPFSEELEHTRAYLAVEQAQFEDLLFVDFDTPHTAFRIPPLTLQPIVENSVKHGMDPDSKPLHIFIRTRETDSDSVVIVEDNGSGFDSVDDSEPHLALTNIQQRLEMMCGGKLEVTPSGEGGTTVKVMIPSDKRHKISALS